MKKLLLLVSVSFIVSTTSAQAFEEGTKVFSLGYGFPNLSYNALDVLTSEPNVKLKGYGPLHAKFEYGIADKIGIGLSINHVNSSLTWSENNIDPFTGNSTNYEYKFVRSSTAANVRLNFHFSNSDMVDAYWGFGLGYRQVSNKWTSNDPDIDNFTWPNLIPLGFETTVGVRVFVTDNFGLYAEVGAAKSIVQAGLCYKL